MLILGNERQSQLSFCLRAAPSFLLKSAEARRIVRHEIDAIKTRWDAVCSEARMSATDRRYLWRRQLLNPFAFEGLPASLQA